MDKYIAEREEKRQKGFALPKYVRYTTVDGTLAFAGVRQVDGQVLALLKRGDEVIVMPVDRASAQRLTRLALGDRLTVTPKGSLKTSHGRSR